MTSKADFNAEDWSKVVSAPAMAALRVAAADRGGTFKESISLARAYQEARGQESGLLGEILSSPPEIGPQDVKDKAQLGAVARERIREALGILERHAGPDELGAYREFILKVADTVAHAHKEGGFLGVGGKEVSESERSALAEIADALGLPAPAS
jgi:hypothetical protein